MSDRAASGFPALASAEAVAAVVRQAVGSTAVVHVRSWHVQRQNYVVAAVETEHPALRLIVKLEVPGERPNRNLDAMAAIARLVRAQTSVPTFDVLAVDVSRQQWPWVYLVVTEVPGVTFASLYPHLDDAARATAQHQIGRSAAALHALRFDTFGQIGPDGAVLAGTTPLPALKRRALQRLQNPRYRSVMLDVLESHAPLFEALSTPTLCHEDLNPFNLVFEMRDGQPVLSGILDFESAWASSGESDLARLELWDFTTGHAIRAGYNELADLADAYSARRPALQLLWCLEFAEHVPSAAHQALTNRVCAELGIAPIQFARQ